MQRRARPVRGRFITFEGGEGAGKSTQITLLADALTRAGIAVETTREPGGSPGAEAIRSLLLEGSVGFDPLAETLLFAAARADHVRTRIEPALAEGRWVLCDRFTDSTRAYQGAGSTVPTDAIATLEHLVTNGTRPDLTLILDLDPAIAAVRLVGRAGRPDRFEAERDVFHHRVRAEFRLIAAEEPDRCVLIDAAGPLDAIAAVILATVMARVSMPTCSA